jgi:2-polyprenyl-6-methoxyphenol hydroxylase-like FAD-dependent oxidoreductase/catechol 2,3-dioxygenase-like lactoylglutathione lyase family enzyme
MKRAHRDRDRRASSSGSAQREHAGDVDCEVAILGYGPVGQAMAALLGRAGHSVSVFERYEAIYPLPRAVHFDHEIMRLMQLLGIAEDLAADLYPIRAYEWFGSDGAPIFTIRPPAPAASGWEPDYMFFQPLLERALDAAARGTQTVSVERGWSGERVAQGADAVELELRGTKSDQRRTVRARYLIGADGANSVVREAAGISYRDLGFHEQWLVVDVLPRDIEALSHLPDACQWCDPRRPHMHARNGRRHRRWEFMLLPEERASDFDEPARIWHLLAPFLTPAEGEITRHAVYEFRSMLAERMREGRVLIAGDAAHLTPPFMGQGLCAGLRDTLNIAWKLDLVLRGLAGESLLDTVHAERQAQNEWIVNLAVEMGRVSCQLDPAAAAERDAELRAAGELPPLQLAPVAAGVIQRGPDGAPQPPAGSLSVQGRVAAQGREGLFDDVVGGGFQLIAAEGEPRERLTAEQLALLAELGTRIASLDQISDLDGRLSAWLAERTAHAVLIRPDFYVFGSAVCAAALPALVEDLRSQLMPMQGEDHPMTPSAPVIKPALHHVNLKTTRLQEMIDFYCALVGVEVIHQDALGAWLSNDEANHRIALLAFPNFVDDPDKETRTGMHHSGFEYASFDELNDSYLRLRDAGIKPALCLDHGMTFSYYYADPDGNNVELQTDNFGDWARSKHWMQSSREFGQNPIGQFVDPELVAGDRAAGMSFEEIHAKAMAGGYAPAEVPVEVPQPEATA